MTSFLMTSFGNNRELSMAYETRQLVPLKGVVRDALASHAPLGPHAEASHCMGRGPAANKSERLSRYENRRHDKARWLPGLPVARARGERRRRRHDFAMKRAVRELRRMQRSAWLD